MEYLKIYGYGKSLLTILKVFDTMLRTLDTLNSVFKRFSVTIHPDEVESEQKVEAEASFKVSIVARDVAREVAEWLARFKDRFSNDIKIPPSLYLI